MYRYKKKKGQEKREKPKLLSILLLAMLVPLETILKSTFHYGVSPLGFRLFLLKIH
jgi:hypothetical protein